MECPKCGASNAPLKKSCYRCGSILSGPAINNVTGEYGFRNPDGTFTVGGVKMSENGTITLPVPIGSLIHEPTGCSISVFRPISRFKAFMLRWCFGLKYQKRTK